MIVKIINKESKNKKFIEQKLNYKFINIKKINHEKLISNLFKVFK